MKKHYINVTNKGPFFMKSSRFIFVIWLFFFVSFKQLVFGSNEDSVRVKNLKIAGIVLPSKSPEQGWYAQGGIVGLFKTINTDSILRASNVYLFGMYSQYNQYRISVGGDIFTPKEKFYFYHWSYFSYVPQLFYGISNHADANVFEFIDYNSWYSNTIGLRKVKYNWYMGGELLLENVYHINFDSVGLYANDVLNHKKHFNRYGLGIHSRIDSRNTLYGTSQGIYYDISFMPYFNNFKSYSYLYIGHDIRNYKTINFSSRRNVVWANRWYTQFVKGDVPFKYVPGILNRAFNEQLFKNDLVSSLESEIRMKLFSRYSFSSFAGLTYIAGNGFKGINETLKWNAGGGLRINIIPTYNLYIRVEYGVGSGNSSNLYVSFYDAF